MSHVSLLLLTCGLDTNRKTSDAASKQARVGGQMHQFSHHPPCQNIYWVIGDVQYQGPLQQPPKAGSCRETSPKFFVPDRNSTRGRQPRSNNIQMTQGKHITRNAKLQCRPEGSIANMGVSRKNRGICCRSTGRSINFGQCEDHECRRLTSAGSASAHHPEGALLSHSSSLCDEGRDSFCCWCDRVPGAFSP